MPQSAKKWWEDAPASPAATATRKWYEDDAPATKTPETATPSRGRHPAAIIGDQVMHAAGQAWDEINPMHIVRGLTQIVGHPVDTAVGAGRAIQAAHARAQNNPAAPLMGPGGTLGELLLGDIRDQALAGDPGGAAGRLVGRAGALVGGPKINQVVGRGMQSVAKSGAGAILEQAADSPVVATALRERALPGLVRSGEARATSRLAGADAAVRADLAGPAGQTIVKARPGAAVQEVWADIYRQPSPGGDAARARRIVQDASDHPRLTTPTAENVFDVASGAGARGDPMNKALGRDYRAAVATAVPSSAPRVARVEDLVDLTDAYRGAPTAAIPVGGLPTMNARLIASTINRAFGPSMQGAYDTGRLVGSPVLSESVRAAILREMVARHDTADGGELLGQSASALMRRLRGGK